MDINKPFTKLTMYSHGLRRCGPSPPPPWLRRLCTALHHRREHTQLLLPQMRTASSAGNARRCCRHELVVLLSLLHLPPHPPVPLMNVHCRELTLPPLSLCRVLALKARRCYCPNVRRRCYRIAANARRCCCCAIIANACSCCHQPRNCTASVECAGTKEESKEVVVEM